MFKFRSDVIIPRPQSPDLPEIMVKYQRNTVHILIDGQLALPLVATASPSSPTGLSSKGRANTSSDGLPDVVGSFCGSLPRGPSHPTCPRPSVATRRVKCEKFVVRLVLNIRFETKSGDVDSNTQCIVNLSCNCIPDYWWSRRGRLVQNRPWP
jgi:hypothetical protein